MEMIPIAVQTLAGVLERATGQQMLAGRHWRIATALLPLMREQGLASLEALAGAVAVAPHGTLATAVAEALLNQETSFFRDPEAFRLLVDEGFDTLRAARGDRRLRLWSAGCASGQEAYSLAMALAAQPARWAGWAVEITGSDVSARAVARARDGLFSHFEVQRGLPIALLVGHFTAAGEAWRIAPELRRAVDFQRHTLLDPPFATGFDAILCRNVLLYFSAERRRLVLARLAAALAPDGLLMLGAGETLLDCGDLFRADPRLKGLYRRAG